MIAPEIRACLSALAIAHNTQKPVTSIYDYAKSEHHDISATFKGNILLGFDIQRASRLTGTLPNIHDSDLNNHFTLERDGNRYRGYDHASKTHFDIEVNDRAASFYDHDEKEWSQFSAV